MPTERINSPRNDLEKGCSSILPNIAGRYLGIGLRGLRSLLSDHKVLERRKIEKFLPIDG